MAAVRVNEGLRPLRLEPRTGMFFFFTSFSLLLNKCLFTTVKLRMEKGHDYDDEHRTTTPTSTQSRHVTTKATTIPPRQNPNGRTKGRMAWNAKTAALCSIYFVPQVSLFHFRYI